MTTPALTQRRAWSLAARLTAWNTVAAFLVVLLATGFLYGALASNLAKEDQEVLASNIKNLRVIAARSPGNLDDIRQEVVEDPTTLYPRLFLRLQDSKGRTLLETPDMAALLPARLFRAVPVRSAPEGGTLLRPKSGVVYLAMVVAGLAPGDQDVIQAAVDRSKDEALLARYRRLLLEVLIVSLLVCGALAYAVARLGLAPVRAIAGTAKRISSQTLSERISQSRFPAELQDLADAFDEMLDRLEQAFGRLGQFASDIAHELRTPLNNLRGEAEVALSRSRPEAEYREILGSCLEEYGRLAQIVDSLLFMARAEASDAELSRGDVEIGPELEAIRDYYEPAAAERDVSLQVRCAEGILAQADKPLLQRAIGNLVSNAIRHTPAGGHVQLSAAQENGGVTIAVSDTGTGISAEHLPHIFDRFYRVAPGRAGGEGVGLGLALVQTICALHGGTVTADSTTGLGTTVTMKIPAGL